MKKIVSRQTEDVVLRCNCCDKTVGKIVWRADLEGIVIGDHNDESLDFCSKRCGQKWVKEHISFEKLKSKKVMEYKEDVEGMEEVWEC